MGETTGIAWCNHTHNMWWGCVKVSEACRDCYALAWDKRIGGNHWGPTARRRFFGEKHHAAPLKWNRAASKAGKRARVFCSSMADVFEQLPPGHPDDAMMYRERARLFEIIANTPWLDWLLLTKRPENIQRMVPERWTKFPPLNVWLGTTVESQEVAAERLKHLLSIPAAVHFVSAEPLLSRLDLRAFMWPTHWHWDGRFRTPEDARAAGAFAERKPQLLVGAGVPFVDWVIVGGESGPNARPFDLGWASDLQQQCIESRTAFFMKQVGDNPISEPGPLTWPTTAHHGADPTEWPVHLQKQEFPKARAAA